MQTEDVAIELATWEARQRNMGVTGQVHFEEHRAAFMRMASTALNDWKAPRWMLRDSLILACLNSPCNDPDDDHAASFILSNQDMDDYWWQMADHIQHFIEQRYPV